MRRIARNARWTCGRRDSALRPWPTGACGVIARPRNMMINLSAAGNAALNLLDENALRGWGSRCSSSIIKFVAHSPSQSFVGASGGSETESALHKRRPDRASKMQLRILDRWILSWQGRMHTWLHVRFKATERWKAILT